jgi:ribosome-associated protein
MNKDNMYETEELVKRIAEGIQEKKGKDIVVADLTDTDNSVCKYFVICEGNTPTQVAAIADSVNDYVRIHMGVKPTVVEGLRNARWVAMDYSDVLVHIFVPEDRTFYNLENLWADARLNLIPNLE